MSPGSSSHLVAELEGYGITRDKVRLFGQKRPDADLQEYLALNAQRAENQPAPDGVAEYQERPVLYFVEERRLSGHTTPPRESLFDSQPEELPVIVRQLACRGERAYLARVLPGQLLVAPVSFGTAPSEWVPYAKDSTDGRTLFSRLVDGRVDWDEIGRGDDVFNRLRDVLNNSAGKLGEDPKIRPYVLSLVGRALFFRFLRDRHIVTQDEIPQIAPDADSWDECFDGPRNASSTCAWLDRTFNGDFLPLPDGGNEAFFRRLEKLTHGDIFGHLGAVLLAAEPQGSHYQLRFDWQDFDFAHVPIGLLSQVYEDFCWHWERGKTAAPVTSGKKAKRGTEPDAKETSVHYTPRNIAVTLLDEAFQGHEKPATCRVLDPACGAGVFLVLAFRRLYKEHWKADGKRPGRMVIRSILSNQLVGFDISEDALRLAALSLYLTAIELDPKPQPITDLQFENLWGRTLVNYRRASDRKTGPVIGSLGKHVGSEHDGRYDIVLSNPPWTAVKKLGKEYECVSRAVLKRARIRDARNYTNPDNNPDLPFLFRSTEWCKLDGRIAMALPARVIIRNEDRPASARTALFRLVEVTDIISGVNLAKTPVWPGTDLPFVLLVANNRTPGERSRTQLVCPRYDRDLNDRGEFRIDGTSSRLVDGREAEEDPWIWKAWCVGTSLDVEIVRKLTRNPDARRLAEYWTKKKLASGPGYVHSESDRQYPAKSLQGLPDLRAEAGIPAVIDTAALPKFDRETLHRVREPEQYRAPLVLIRLSPGEKWQAVRAHLAYKDTAYIASFSGFSTTGHPRAEELARYLHLYIHSSIWLHYGLMTCPQFGAERNKLREQTVDAVPFIPIEHLTTKQASDVERLSAKLISDPESAYDEIDRFFGQLYKLAPQDLEVIRDTLEVGRAYRATSGKRACAAPTWPERKRFLERVRILIAPQFDKKPEQVPGKVWYPQTGSGQDMGTFSAILFGTPTQDPSELYFKHVLPLADKTGASQVLVGLDGGGLVVGLRDQYRYWTPTRARLLAADIIRDWMGYLSEDTE